MPKNEQNDTITIKDDVSAKSTNKRGGRPKKEAKNASKTESDSVVDL
jgi:hypothetical protein